MKQTEGKAVQRANTLSMTRIVTAEFTVDKPDWLHNGPHKFTFPKGSQLLRVTRPDHFGHVTFTHAGCHLKALANVVLKHTQEESTSC